MEMHDIDFNHFCELARVRSGLVLNNDKRYLVEGRLLTIAHEEQLGSVGELLAKLRAQPVDRLIQRCVEAMATHETSFFRDRLPFDQLITTVIPRLRQANMHKRNLKIWSAACSTGQEPYSIAMTLLHRAPELHEWNIEILATELSNVPLEQARAGRYSAFEMKRGLTDFEIAQNFARLSPEVCEVLPQLKRWITFRTHNLLEGYHGLGPFDVIFCRNVLIYFDRQTKLDVLEKLSSVLTPTGVLVLGSAETVVGLGPAFTMIKGARGLYQLTESAQAPV